MSRRHSSAAHAVPGDGFHVLLQPFLLTPREEEILTCLLQGLSNKEIASHCFVCEQTVKDHLKHIYQKVGIHHRSALLAWLFGTDNSSPALR